MLRLRTTTSLSALALLVGVAGTGWISSLTAQWREPSDRVAMVERMPVTRRTPPQTHRLHRPVAVVPARHAWRYHPSSDSAGRAAVAAPITALQPLSMPADTSQSWDELRGHLDGQVLVRLRVDGAGRVQGASVIASSGDPILDRHALRSVRAWRFAVPADHPDGLSGELPMRFSSQQGRQLGML
jgi:protein TonB